jgi:hypothetical protein
MCQWLQVIYVVQNDNKKQAKSVTKLHTQNGKNEVDFMSNAGYQKTVYMDKNGKPTKAVTRPLYSPYDPEKGYNFKYKSNKIQSYFGIDLPEELNITEKGRLYVLSKKLYPGSNMLGKRVGSGVRPFRTDELAEIVQLKGRQMRNFLSKAIRLNVIRLVEYKDKDGIQHQYYMNPVFFNACRYISLNLFILFQDSFRQYLPKKILDLFLDQQEALQSLEKGKSKKA